MKKFISILLSCCILMALAVPAFAAEKEPPQATPRYDYAVYTSASLTISSNGMAVCTSKVSSMGKVTGADIYMELQKWDGREWDFVDSWLEYVSGSSPTLRKTIPVSKGSYQVIADFTIHGNDGGSEPASAISTTVTY